MAEDNSDDRTIEISIEALTGTVYDLCVSPYETILGIKLKVQRLEGIPVYQQQLVWGDTELQDEFCLEEYCIKSGAQLKLMVAMRGGPIHAQRVHVDVEEDAFLEIAELLDTQHGDKYALMVLRSGDDLEHASIVQVQMLEDDSMDTVRLSPIHVSESSAPLSMGGSKTAQLENAMTRDKMKLLMAKLKKGKNYRQQAASFSQLRTGTGKVLIVENRAPSRVLTPPRRASSIARTHPVDARRVDRKLVFRGEEETATAGSHVICSGKGSTKQQPRSFSGHRSRSYDPDQDTPIIAARKTASRIGLLSRPQSQALPDKYSPAGDSHDLHTRPNGSSITRTPPTPLGHTHHHTHNHHHHHHHHHSPGDTQQLRGSQRSSKKLCSGETQGEMVHLSSNLAHLHLNSPPLRQSGKAMPEVGGAQSSQRTWRRIGHEKTRADSSCDPMVGQGEKQGSSSRKNTSSNLSKHRLPPLVPSLKAKPISMGATPSSKTALQGHLPSLSVAARGGRVRGAGIGSDAGGANRKKRCMQCGKRLGLATTYSCRCGGLFCALHRYAEAHMCSYDYKSEGRRLLARTNPVIAAPKLPKI